MLAECGCAVVVEWVIVAFSSVKLFEVRGMRFAVEAPDGAFDDFSQDEALQKEAVGAIVCDGGLAVGGVVDGVVDEVEGIGFWVWLVGDGATSVARSRARSKRARHHESECRLPMRHRRMPRRRRLSCCARLRCQSR